MLRTVSRAVTGGMIGLGFRVSGLGFRVSGLGFRDWDDQGFGLTSFGCSVEAFVGGW